MRFQPFVYDKESADKTAGTPLWQTSWNSEYLADARFEKYAAKVGEKNWLHWERTRSLKIS